MAPISQSISSPLPRSSSNGSNRINFNQFNQKFQGKTLDAIDGINAALRTPSVAGPARPRSNALVPDDIPHPAIGAAGIFPLAQAVFVSGHFIPIASVEVVQAEASLSPSPISFNQEMPPTFLQQ